MTSSSLALFLSLLCTLALVQAQLRVFDLRARNLPHLLGTTDAYVKVFYDDEEIGKTKVRRDNKNPWWEEEFDYYQAALNGVLGLEVFDHDLLSDDQLGICEIQIEKGTHHDECKLKRGGILYYSYSLK